MLLPPGLTREVRKAVESGEALEERTVREMPSVVDFRGDATTGSSYCLRRAKTLTRSIPCAYRTGVTFANIDQEQHALINRAYLLLGRYQDI